LNSYGFENRLLTGKSVFFHNDLKEYILKDFYEEDNNNVKQPTTTNEDLIIKNKTKISSEQQQLVVNNKNDLSLISLSSKQQQPQQPPLLNEEEENENNKLTEGTIFNYDREDGQSIYFYCPKMFPMFSKIKSPESKVVNFRFLMPMNTLYKENKTVIKLTEFTAKQVSKSETFLIIPKSEYVN